MAVTGGGAFCRGPLLLRRPSAGGMENSTSLWARAGGQLALAEHLFSCTVLLQNKGFKAVVDVVAFSG